jgi:hypothetical protein
VRLSLLDTVMRSRWLPGGDYDVSETSLRFITRIKRPFFSWHFQGQPFRIHWWEPEKVVVI